MNLFEETIKEVMQTRAEHLESFAAAFLLQVGSKEASQYRLIETFTDNTTKGGGFTYAWHFEKINETSI